VDTILILGFPAALPDARPVDILTMTQAGENMTKSSENRSSLGAVTSDWRAIVDRAMGRDILRPLASGLPVASGDESRLGARFRPIGDWLA
jgi:hypothetical protein